MKHKLLSLFVTLLCATAAWATDYSVKNDSELRTAIANDGANITVTADFVLSNSTLVIGSNKTVTIDLGGHTLDRKLTARNYDTGGQVITVRSGGTLNLSNGTLKGGWGGNGGGIVNESGTVNLNNVTITGCTGDDRGGGIVNYGTLTIDGCTITGNTAKANGGAGIWNDGSATLNMQGTNTIKDNWKPNGMRSNLYLKNGSVITITGDLADSHIGIGMETLGTFTKGYSTYHDVNPASFFTSDIQSIIGMRAENGEALLEDVIPAGGVYYVERSWNETAKRVEAAYQVRESYTTLTGGSDNTYLDPGWYVVKGSDVEYSNMIYMNGGGEYHLILCDGASLKAWFFIVNSPNVLHIHGQADDTGKMANTYTTLFSVHRYYAGLGADTDEANGPIFIHGGDINVHGGDASPGIGNNSYTEPGGAITIYGGTVHAEGDCEHGSDGGGGGAGIGGGWFNDCGVVNIYGGSVYATGRGNTSGGAGIGSGSYAHNSGTITIYGGYVEATGDIGSAGIGGGKGTNGADVTIHGGTVIAKCNKYKGPGIGAGQNDDNRITYTGTLTVTGGKVYAYGDDRGAGIGGGWNTNGSNVTVSGGYVYAEGGKYAAGIGSGCEYITGGERHGGTLTVTGGYVEAHGGEDGAGIGGGEDADGGTVNISDGEVRAYGSYGGAGIGGGEDGNGGKVTITGGTVIAQAGKIDTGYRAIGPGKGSDNYGSLTLGDDMMVSAERMANAAERKNMCWYRAQARVEPCAHSSLTYTVSGTTNNDTHTAHCQYCAKQFAAEPHDFSVSEECSVCHVHGTVYNVSVYLPKTDGTAYDSPVVNKMVAGTQFNLPAAPEDRDPVGLEFAGWLTATPEGLSSFETTPSETLLDPGTQYTVDATVNLTARYRKINITLADNASNGETLSNYDGKLAASVTFSGRTLYKDGTWNTLCLPFSLATLTGTPLAGATLKELDVEGTYDTKQTSFDSSDGTLYLYFKDATGIEAGKPYLIKWESGTDIENPVFNSITIDNVQNDVTSEDGKVIFNGNFDPVALEGGDKSSLYLGASNTLYWPSEDRILNSLRAYFHVDLSDDVQQQEVRAIRMNLSDKVTDVPLIDNGQLIIDNYSLPSKRIVNGRLIIEKNGKKFNATGARIY